MIGAFLFSILAGQPKFGEAIELLIPRWVKLLDTDLWLFCFDTLCQLAYMITNANASNN